MILHTALFCTRILHTPLLSINTHDALYCFFESVFVLSCLVLKVVSALAVVVKVDSYNCMLIYAACN